MMHPSTRSRRSRARLSSALLLWLLLSLATVFSCGVMLDPSYRRDVYNAPRASLHASSTAANSLLSAMSSAQSTLFSTTIAIKSNAMVFSGNAVSTFQASWAAFTTLDQASIVDTWSSCHFAFNTEAALVGTEGDAQIILCVTAAAPSFASSAESCPIVEAIDSVSVRLIDIVESASTWVMDSGYPSSSSSSNTSHITISSSNTSTIGNSTVSSNATNKSSSNSYSPWSGNHIPRSDEYILRMLRVYCPQVPIGMGGYYKATVEGTCSFPSLVLKVVQRIVLPVAGLAIGLVASLAIEVAATTIGVFVVMPALMLLDASVLMLETFIITPIFKAFMIMVVATSVLPLVTASASLGVLFRLIHWSRQSRSRRCRPRPCRMSSSFRLNLPLLFVVLMTFVGVTGAAGGGGATEMASGATAIAIGSAAIASLPAGSPFGRHDPNRRPKQAAGSKRGLGGGASKPSPKKKKVGMCVRFAQILKFGILGGSPHAVGLHGKYKPDEIPSEDDRISIANSFAKPWLKLLVKHQGRLEEVPREKFEAAKKEIEENEYDKASPGGQYVRGWWRTKKEWTEAFNLFLSEHEDDDFIDSFPIVKLKVFIENWLEAHDGIDDHVTLGVYYFGETENVSQRMKAESNGGVMDGAKCQWLFCKFIGDGRPDLWMKIGEYGGSQAQSHVLEASNLIVAGGYARLDDPKQ